MQQRGFGGLPLDLTSLYAASRVRANDTVRAYKKRALLPQEISGKEASNIEHRPAEEGKHDGDECTVSQHGLQRVSPP